MNGLVYEAQSTGAEVQDVIISKLLPVLTGMRLELAVSAMCTLMLAQMCPTITPDQLVDGVKGMSGWLVTYVSGLDAPQTERAN